MTEYWLFVEIPFASVFPYWHVVVVTCLSQRVVVETPDASMNSATDRALIINWEEIGDP